MWKQIPSVMRCQLIRCGNVNACIFRYNHNRVCKSRCTGLNRTSEELQYVSGNKPTHEHTDSFLGYN